ncbi:MAG: glycosyltransferase family 39 protein, partial [Candidatus Abyssubacteria bacterium]|nr:glycosyltransferase family 39 protein [Candidatus Abyssubacteria bacterium]
MFCFFREHPIDPDYVRRLIQDYQPPPLPRDFLKLFSAGKHLFLACVLVLVGILAGRRMLRIAGVKQGECQPGDTWGIVQELVLALGLGLGLLMYMTFLLGVVGGLYTAAIWGLLLFLLAVSRRDFLPLFRDLRVLLKPDKAQAQTYVKLIGACLAGVMLVLIAIIALAPSITHDAMVYHLNVPRNYVIEHRIVPVPYDLFSNTFLNLEMLYMAALLIDDFILANLIHYILGVGVLVFLYAFARRNFGGATATVAVLLFFFNPLFLNQLPIAYVDIGMTFYFLLAIYCMWKWKTGGGERWFVLLCIFAGIFAGMKYTSIYGLISISLMIAVSEFSSGERRFGKTLKRLALFGGIVTIFVLPYLVKNYVITGNPVYPVAYGVFGGKWLVPAQVERMLAYVDSHGMGHDWRNMLALPWNITIMGKAGFEKFDTTITPLWLIFLPALLLTRPNPPAVKWSVFVCMIYFLCWASYTHITRYMMPIFPLLSLACAHAIVALKDKAALHSQRLATTVKTGAILMCALAWFSFSYFYPSRVPSEFGEVVWGRQTREEFLAEKVPNYGTFKYINKNLPADARLVFFWDNRGFFCERPKVGDSVI